MSVVINTNTAATIASNNLSASNAMLQRSLNRLSSGSKIVNASDDAGGVAVASRLNSAAKRSGVAGSNISSAVSFLQHQDTVLKTMGKMLERMSELQSLNLDTTKSDDDKANYALEFDNLKSELVDMQGTTFNGLDVVGSDAVMSIHTNDADSTYSISEGIAENVTGYSDLRISGDASAGTSRRVTGAEASDTDSLDADDGGTFTINGVTVSIAKDDTAAEIASAINTALDAEDPPVAITAAAVEGKIQLTNDNVGTTAIELGGADLAAVGLDNVDVNAAGSAALPAAEEQLQDAIQAVASARAQNGADQSVLGYRAELASASKSNYESAVSKIMDVDVAEESTQLARWNTLVQAGTAMVAQANGTTQNVLTLLR